MGPSVESFDAILTPSIRLIALGTGFAACSG